MLRRGLAVAVLSTALSAIALSACASAASTHTSPTTLALTCAGATAFKPASYIISCADANSYLKSLHWTSWTTTRASAAGTYWANDCTPYCAAGKFRSYPATVTLSVPKATRAHGRLFSELSVNYTSGKTTKHVEQSLPLTSLSSSSR